MKAVLIVGSGFAIYFLFAAALKLAMPIIELGGWPAGIVGGGLLVIALAALCWLPAFLIERLRPRL